VYRSRWVIEEYFKALKTGCSIEKRQLESYEALANALALLVPVAWRMLLARSAARTSPNAPAKTAFESTELIVLKHRLKLKTPPKTVKEALYATAKLGGHLKRNGPPGWGTLGKGMEELLLLCAGWRLATQRPQARCDQ
jgi:hypothetical protein